MAMDTNDTIYQPPSAPRRSVPAYSKEGVDLTQIRRLLSLTPGERLREMEEFLADLEALLLKKRTCSSGES